MSAQDSGNSFITIVPEKNVEDWMCIEDDDDKQTWIRYKMAKCPCPEV